MVEFWRYKKGASFLLCVRSASRDCRGGDCHSGVEEEHVTVRTADEVVAVGDVVVEGEEIWRTHKSQHNKGKDSANMEK